MAKYNKGNILREINATKFGLILFVLATAIIAMLASIFGGRIELVRADYGTSLAGEEFSFVDNNNLIMSVEKVGVISDSDLSTSTPLYHSDDNSIFEKMLSRDDVELYYTDIADDNNDKYVVHNNEYVMLENRTDDNELYFNPDLSAYYKDSETSQNINVNVQEAILISFGQYIYKDNTIIKARTVYCFLFLGMTAQVAEVC